jgi:multidrug efflux pump subunit AcrB
MAFEEYFDRMRGRYHGVLHGVLVNRKEFVVMFLAGIGLSVFVLIPFLGENFFPSIDSGQIKMHIRAHAGTRVEEMARICDGVDAIIRRVIPKDELPAHQRH